MFYSHIKQKAIYTFYFPQPFLDLSQKWFSIVEVLVVADRLTWLCVVDEGAEDEEGEQGSQEKIFPDRHGSVVCRSGVVVILEWCQVPEGWVSESVTEAAALCP